MRKLTVIISVAASLCMTVSALAQSVDGQVQVTRDYNPTTTHMGKLTIQPNMTDTVMLHPEVDYSITPTAWLSVYDPRPISPATVSTSSWERPTPFYLKVGGGLPLHSLLEFRYTPIDRGPSSLGVSLSHVGREADIKNVLLEKNSALSLDNSLGLSYRHTLGEGDLRFDVGVGNRMYDPYSGPSSDGLQIRSYDRAVYNDVTAAISVGSDFENMSVTNVRFGVHADYFDARSKGVLGTKDSQLVVGGDLKVAVPVQRNYLTLSAGVDRFHGMGDMDVSKTVVDLSGVYSVHSSRLLLDLGVRYLYNSSSYVIPVVNLSYALSGSFMPYVSIDSELHDSSMRGLSEANPYIRPSSWVDDFRVDVTARAGAVVLTDPVSLDISAGYDILDNYPLYVPTEHESRFGVYTERLRIPYVQIKAKLPVTPRLGILASARHNFSNGTQDGQDSNLQNLFDGTGISETVISGAVQYAKGPLCVTMSAAAASKRSFAWSRGFSYTSGIVNGGEEYVSQTEDGVLNLGFNVTYSLNSTLDAFLQGDNLLSNNIYNFAFYRELGANVMAGIRLRF